MNLVYALRRNARRGPMLLLALVTSATALCACSVTLRAKMPESAAPPSASVQNAKIALAVRDGRVNTSAGGIGAAGVEVGPELIDYIGSDVKRGLNIKQLSVVDTKESALPSGVDRKAVVTLQSASVTSFDALLQPATARVAIAVQIYNPRSQVIFAGSYTGSASETLGIRGKSGYEENIGRLLATAAESAVQQIFDDRRFADAISASPIQTSSRPSALDLPATNRFQ